MAAHADQDLNLEKVVTHATFSQGQFLHNVIIEVLPVDVCFPFRRYFKHVVPQNSCPLIKLEIPRCSKGAGVRY